MREKTLVFISFVCSAFGILFLLFISLRVQPEKKNPLEYDEGDYVLVEGKVLQATKKNSTTFLVVEQVSEIDVVVFDDFPFKRGQYVELLGTVEKQNKRISIVADKVKVK